MEVSDCFVVAFVELGLFVLLNFFFLACFWRMLDKELWLRVISVGFSIGRGVILDLFVLERALKLELSTCS